VRSTWPVASDEYRRVIRIYVNRMDLKFIEVFDCC